MSISGNERLLALRKIMEDETDEDSQLSIKELISKLKVIFNDGSDFDARAIKRDLQTLDNNGFEVISDKGKYGKLLYSHQDRLFETYQLRLMSDAILSARFITESDKQILIKKLKKLTSKTNAKTLPDTLIFNPSANFDYSLIKLNIDRVHAAITNYKTLRYQYGKFNVDKEFEYNRDGDIYNVEPYALIWRNDFYYLIGKFIPTNEFRHYRLDRIRNIQVTEERFRRENFDITKYVDQTFHMFAGEEHRIKIKFEHDLINVIIDRFGLDADIKKMDDEYILLTAKAKLSSGLISWVLRWGHRAEVISPDILVNEIKDEISKMKNLY